MRVEKMAGALVAPANLRLLRQRARALIDIAAPEFRAELEQKAIELTYL